MIYNKNQKKRESENYSRNSMAWFEFTTFFTFFTVYEYLYIMCMNVYECV